MLQAALGFLIVAVGLVVLVIWLLYQLGKWLLGGSKEHTATHQETEERFETITEMWTRQNRDNNRHITPGHRDWKGCPNCGSGRGLGCSERPGCPQYR